MNSRNLTVIVKDTHNNLIKDAPVSINPGNTNGKTDTKGQVFLSLPPEKKVTIIVKTKDISQSVSYYPTTKANDFLEINLAFFQQIQTQNSTNKITPISPTKINHWSIFIILAILLLTTLFVFQLTKKNTHLSK